MTGRVAITFSTLSGAIALAREGKLKPIAIAAPRRSPAFPNVPTMAESGVPIRDTSPWYSFVAPAGLPQAISDRIVRDVQGLLKRPDIIARIEASGGIVEGEGQAEFRARIPREIAINTEVARESNIHID
jgi:tripartite-type tricarboxylate transporter receptor subunit TctC